MNFQTFSIVVGTTACNAKCPFCVSKVTCESNPQQKSEVLDEDGLKGDIYHDRLRKSIMFAERKGIDTVLITGRGEPTLYPDDVSYVLEETGKHFPFVELQTNGICFGNEDITRKQLERWRNWGLNTICISCVHWAKEKNQGIYSKQYPDLPVEIEALKKMGFSIRISCVGLKGYIDDEKSLFRFLAIANEISVDQFTWRPVWFKVSENYENDYTVPIPNIVTIKQILENNHKKLLELPHGAVVYDVNGQNFCLSNCMTKTTNPEDIRQLILFPNGRLAYDWEWPGAVIL